MKVTNRIPQMDALTGETSSRERNGGRPRVPRYEQPAYKFMKRTIDIVLGSAGLLVLAPVFFLISLVVVRGDGFPIIFKQRRIGQRGNVFYIYKFRSMRRDAEQRLQELLARDPEKRREFEETYKLKDDPRIIPFGAFLRSSSLDELPQLLNVVIGNMTLVGPRPVVEKEMEKLGDEATIYKAMKPGCAGLWQCSGRSDTTYEERLRLNREYYETASIRKDFVILWKTVKSVLKREGAV